MSAKRQQQLKNAIAKTGYAFYLSEINLADARSKEQVKECKEKNELAYDAFVRACKAMSAFIEAEEHDNMND